MIFRQNIANPNTFTTPLTLKLLYLFNFRVTACFTQN